MTLAAYNSLMNSLTPGVTSVTTAGGQQNLKFLSDANYNQNPPPFQAIGCGYNANYDARLSGFFSVPASGTYYLRTGSDNGSMIWLAGSEVVNNNYYQGFTWRGSNAIQLNAGTAYPIALEYYQGGGGESFEAQYSTDGVNWTDIPNTMLGTAPPSTTYNNNVTVNTGVSTIDVQGALAVNLNALTISPARASSTTTNSVVFNSTTLTGPSSFA